MNFGNVGRAVAVITLVANVNTGQASSPRSNTQKGVRKGYEIEDFIPEPTLVTIDEKNKVICDRRALLPEIPYLLPLPKTFHLMEQIKRVIAWQYKLSPDRDMYKQEYMALLKNPSKLIKYVSDNHSLLRRGVSQMLDEAAREGSTDLYNSAIKFEGDSMVCLINWLYWDASVKPDGGKSMREVVYCRFREEFAEKLMNVTEKSGANGFIFASGKNKDVLVAAQKGAWEGENIQRFKDSLSKSMKVRGFKECRFYEIQTSQNKQSGNSAEADIAFMGESLGNRPAILKGGGSVINLPSGNSLLLIAKVAL